jgi:hypothetical protein
MGFVSSAHPIALTLRVKHGHSGESVLLAYPGETLRRHHLDVTHFDGASTEVVGRVEPHPKEPGHVILRNLSDIPWGYAAAGNLLQIEPKQAAGLDAGGGVDPRGQDHRGTASLIS